MRYPSFIGGLFFLISLIISGATHAEESILDRVEKSKTIRCGYTIWEPYVKKDLVTGEMSGITVDYLNTVAARQGLKIDWAEEMGVDQLIPTLQYKRVDMYCLPCSPLASYEEVIDFVGSFGKLPYYVYVPEDSTLTPDTLKTASFVVMDSFVPAVETPLAFPDAKILSLPQTTSPAELYDQLKYGKAQAILNEHISAMNYMTHNPGIIKRFSDTPVVVKTLTFAIRQDDPRWFKFVDAMTDTQTPENHALLEKLTEKYGLVENSLLY